MKTIIYNLYSPGIKKDNGFTIIELTLTLLIASLISATIYAAYTSQQRSQTAQSQIVELQQDLRSTMNFLTSEIRMAGYDVSNSRTVGTGVVSANAGRFRFTWDKNKNGQLVTSGDGDPDEDIEYKFSTDATFDGIPDTDTETFGRRTIGAGLTAGPLQELSSTIDRVEFLYVLEDTTDNNVYDPSRTTSPTAAQLGDIRAITITLLARTSSTAPKHTDTKTYTSGSGAVWPAYNDGFRRRLLITTVKLRNLGL